jgi:hypothetical protein
MSANEPTRYFGDAGVVGGMLLGLCNAFVIGAGIGGANGKGYFEVAAIALAVMLFGSMPAIVIGALLGWLADAMRAQPVWLRRFALIVPAVMVVIVCGVEIETKLIGRGPEHFALLAAIPTAVAAFILERATRSRSTPSVPLAYVAARRVRG